MTARLIKPGIYSLSAIDWDRRLFDELIPLPDGTSYNAYLVGGNDKTALIDTVDPTKTSELVDDLKKLDINIDYVIANHAEQDHSGSIPKILEIYPDARVVTNPKCKDMIKEFLLTPEDKFITVADGETLSLGDKTLKFIYTPWVHWPDTMVTYLKEDEILFTCDFFGSHLATSDLFAADDAAVYRAAKRYYAEIMMPFRAVIRGNIAKIKDLHIEVLAPGHGPIYKVPELILEAYKDWTSDSTKNGVVIVYVSMHGSTEKMVEYLMDALIKKNVIVKQFNLTEIDIGELALALVDASTMVLASPTVLTGPHPKMAYAVYLANALRPKLRFASVMGSYGWGGRMLEQITGMLTNLNAEIIEPVIIKGFPKEDDFRKIGILANEIAKKHGEMNILNIL